MTAYVDLLPEVLPDLPGISDLFAERAIRDAVIRLCEVSGILKHTSLLVDVEPGQPRYAIAVPQGCAYASVQWVTIEGATLKGSSHDYLDLAWRDENAQRALFSAYHTLGFGNGADGWRAFRQSRPQVYFIEREAGADLIRLVGIPESAIVGGLQYRVTLKPLRTAEEVADFVVEDHYRLIAKGAIGQMLRIPKKAWTDTARGLTLCDEFETECGQLRATALKDFVRDDQAISRTRAYS